MKKPIILLIVMLFVSNVTHAQIGFGTTNPDPSAAVDIQDTARGLLIPRMDMAHRNAIQNPAAGLMVYQTDSLEGLWYYNGTSWRTMNNEGKRTIVLTDSITNSQAQAKIAMEFGPNTEEIMIMGCLNLTSVDFSMLTTAKGITIMGNPVLTSVNLSKLKSCEGTLTIIDCPSLSGIAIPALEIITGTSNQNAIYMTKAGFNTLTFPKLRRLIGNTAFSGNPSLTSLSFPALLQADYLDVLYNDALITISFPLLQKTTGFQFILSNSLTTVLLPSLTSITANNNSLVQIRDCPNLSTVTLGNLTTFDNYEFLLMGGKLPSGIINSLLHSFVTIPGLTNKRLAFAGQVPSAPPTGQGITDKATLLANNNTVFTD